MVYGMPGVRRDQNLWSCDDWKGHSPEDQCFLSIAPKNSNSLCHNCPTHLSHKCPIPISHHVLTSHFNMCGNFHHNEHRCASGVGAPPLDTQPLNISERTHSSRSYPLFHISDYIQIGHPCMVSPSICQLLPVHHDPNPNSRGLLQYLHNIHGHMVVP